MAAKCYIVIDIISNMWSVSYTHLYDDRLIEMGFGIYEGTANCEDIPDCPVGMLFRHPEQYIARDGAESMQELWERTGISSQLDVYKRQLLCFSCVFVFPSYSP